MSGPYMSVTDLAGSLGVSKQAISKNLERHGEKIPTRMQGVRKMVDVEAYERVMGEEVEPAQALRNRDTQPRQGPLPAPPSQGSGAQRSPGATAQVAFSVHRAKRESFDAELARLALEKEMGKLVPVARVTDAMVECAMKLTRIIDQLPSKSEDKAVKAILRAAALELRTALYESMNLTAKEAAEEHALEDAGEE